MEARKIVLQSTALFMYQGCSPLHTEQTGNCKGVHPTNGNKAALMSFTFAMKAEEVHAGLYQEALENLDQTEEVFYYLCPVCGNIEKFQPEKCSICGVPGDKFIKY